MLKIDSTGLQDSTNPQLRVDSPWKLDSSKFIVDSPLEKICTIDSRAPSMRGSDTMQKMVSRLKESVEKDGEQERERERDQKNKFYY